MDGVREILELFDRRLRVASLPAHKLGKAVLEIFSALSRTIARPGHKRGMDRGLGHLVAMCLLQCLGPVGVMRQIELEAQEQNFPIAKAFMYFKSRRFSRAERWEIGRAHD